ncbi:MAG: hypothetical protein ACFE0P_01165 [Oceanicaulis sp.]
MGRAVDIAVSVSRRMRIAALTLIALFAVKVAAAALEGAPPAPADRAGAAIAGPETLERME